MFRHLWIAHANDCCFLSDLASAASGKDEALDILKKFQEYKSKSTVLTKRFDTCPFDKCMDVRIILFFLFQLHLLLTTCRTVTIMGLVWVRAARCGASDASWAVALLVAGMSPRFSYHHPRRSLALQLRRLEVIAR